MAKQTKDKAPTLESRMKDLEKIVERIESGKMGMDETLKAFEEGMDLSKECQEMLNQTELRIQKLVEAKGSLRTEPFEAVDADEKEDTI